MEISPGRSATRMVLDVIEDYKDTAILANRGRKGGALDGRQSEAGIAIDNAKLLPSSSFFC